VNRIGPASESGKACQESRAIFFPHIQLPLQCSWRIDGNEVPDPSSEMEDGTSRIIPAAGPEVGTALLAIPRGREEALKPQEGGAAPRAEALLMSSGDGLGMSSMLHVLPERLVSAHQHVVARTAEGRFVFGQQRLVFGSQHLQGNGALRTACRSAVAPTS
jgi:hypothetical protein